MSVGEVPTWSFLGVGDGGEECDLVRDDAGCGFTRAVKSDRRPCHGRKRDRRQVGRLPRASGEGQTKRGSRCKSNWE